ncbi:hypothetical protein OPV22_017677 [Ensete ventricosum]|uniref:Glutaredoxin domain-containing protein n=1 Tax=Ensete ventricosum TaxID=4639 RepID=A0AAV8QSL3_ENSVE|nr:hypothetical protein OPV22_017677 [Ensete ventricosum]
MGCTGSKQLRRRRGRSPGHFVRSHSVPVHCADTAVAQRRYWDDHHAMALSSSTLGSLVLHRGDLSSDDEAMMKITNDLPTAVPQASVAKELGRAKTLSEVIERRIPKTPTMTPPNEPEVINAWELMADLEDASPLLLPAVGVNRSFSFHTSWEVRRSSPDTDLSGRSSSPKPQWMQLRPEDSVVSDFDPEILSSFHKALVELSPQHQFCSIHRPAEPDKKEEEDDVATTRTAESAQVPQHQFRSIRQSPEPDKEEPEEEDQKKKPSHAITPPIESVDGREVPKSISIVRERIDEFQQKIDARKTSSNSDAAKVAPTYKCPSGGQGKVVLYLTSLRGIRKTYEDCWAVGMILRGYGVRVDERDVSMHAGFKDELIDILGPGYGGNGLPRVFADGNYLGGAEEVRHLHELGRLSKLFDCCETMPSMGKGGGGDAGCEGCSGLRFVPCDTCSGSCKVYVEEEEELGGFHRCPECNENGLVRCPLCC